METKSNKSYEVPSYKEVVMRTRLDDGRDESKGHPNKEHLEVMNMIWYKLVWNVTLKIFVLNISDKNGCFASVFVRNITQMIQNKFLLMTNIKNICVK